MKEMLQFLLLNFICPNQTTKDVILYIRVFLPGPLMHVPLALKGFILKNSPSMLENKE